MSLRSRKSYSSIFITVHISTFVKIPIPFRIYSGILHVDNGHSKTFSELEVNERF